MGIGFGIQREVVLFPLHEATAFVGHIIIVVLSADADHRIRTEIGLLNEQAGIGFQMFRKLLDQKFSFDFHVVLLVAKISLG